MSHVSFSELKIWDECAWKHKLAYIDGVTSFEGNEYTAFGTAMHSTCERLVTETGFQGKAKIYFLTEFRDNLKKLPDENALNIDLIKQMKLQGAILIEYVLPALKDYFGSYKVYSVEERLYEPIENESEYKFKGFVDLVIQTSDGKHHVIDWKTCSWGWNSRKKAERMITYQLTFYKYFFCKKHNLDPDNVETHFALLKRTAKKNNIEIFRVTSGNKKIKNALNLLYKALYNIKSKNFVKNKLSCTRGYGCEFYKTKHCP